MDSSSVFDWLSTFLSTYLTRILMTAVVLVFGLGLAWFMQAAVRHLLRRRPLEVQLLLGRLVYISVLVGTALWALATTGVHIAAIATLAGTIGLGISLSLQGRAQDIVAGLYLLTERFFKVGDEVALRGFSGRIESIGSRTVLIRTEDGKQLVVPNTVMLSEVIVKSPEQEPGA